MKSVEECRRANVALLEIEHGGQSELAAALEKSSSQISQWKNASPDSKSGKPRNMRSDTARWIEEKLGKERLWMDEDHSQENAIRESVAPYNPSEMPFSHVNTGPGPNFRGLVPVISWVKAGEWHEAEDNFEPGDADEWHPCLVNHGPHTYILRVEGDSMTSLSGKSYPHGSKIFVDPDQIGGVVSGDRVIAKINGDAHVTFKVFIEDAGRRFLKPLNSQYPVITDEFRIIGKVIGKWEDE